MTGYTKLFGSIIASTIWREDDKTRIVWITMLAMKNRFHEVETSIPGLATLAGVSIADTRAAIVKLETPDPDSRSDEYEGRRIEKIEGGWLILNGQKYCERMSADEQREKARIRQQRHRERITPVTPAVTQSHKMSRLSRHADADKDAEEKKNTIASNGDGFDVFWKAYPKKKKKGEARKAWSKLKPRPTMDVVLDAISRQQTWADWKKENGQFIPYPASWLNSEQWLDEPISSATPYSQKAPVNPPRWDEFCKIFEDGRHEHEFPIFETAPISMRDDYRSWKSR